MVALININHHFYHYQHQNGILPMLGIVVLGLFITEWGPWLPGWRNLGLFFFFFVYLTVNPFCLSILNIAVCTYQSQTPVYYSLPTLPPGTGLFSYSKNPCERSFWSLGHIALQRAGLEFWPWQAGLPWFSIFHSNCFFHSSVTWGLTALPFLTYQSTIISRNKHWNICLLGNMETN